jgi:hypothetical protein
VKKFTDDEVRTALEQAGTVRGAAKLLDANHRSLIKRIRRMQNAGVVLPTATVYPIMPAGQKLHDTM